MKEIPALPSKEMGQLSVALYSPEQNCFHIETLIEYLENNIRHALEKSEWNSYQVIGIFKKDIDANTYIETFRQHQERVPKYDPK